MIQISLINIVKSIILLLAVTGLFYHGNYLRLELGNQIGLPGVDAHNVFYKKNSLDKDNKQHTKHKHDLRNIMDLLDTVDMARDILDTRRNINKNSKKPGSTSKDKLNGNNNKLNKDKLNKDKLNKDELNKDKFNKDDLNQDKLNKDGLNKDKMNKDKLNKDGSNKDKLNSNKQISKKPTDDLQSDIKKIDDNNKKIDDIRKKTEHRNEKIKDVKAKVDDQFKKKFNLPNCVGKECGNGNMKEYDETLRKYVDKFQKNQGLNLPSGVIDTTTDFLKKTLGTIGKFENVVDVLATGVKVAMMEAINPDVAKEHNSQSTIAPNTGKASVPESFESNNRTGIIDIEVTTNGYDNYTTNAEVFTTPSYFPNEYFKSHGIFTEEKLEKIYRDYYERYGFIFPFEAITPYQETQEEKEMRMYFLQKNQIYVFFGILKDIELQRYKQRGPFTITDKDERIEQPNPITVTELPVTPWTYPSNLTLSERLEYKREQDLKEKQTIKNATKRPFIDLPPIFTPFLYQNQLNITDNMYNNYFLQSHLRFNPYVRNESDTTKYSFFFSEGLRVALEDMSGALNNKYTTTKKPRIIDYYSRDEYELFKQRQSKIDKIVNAPFLGRPTIPPPRPGEVDEYFAAWKKWEENFGWFFGKYTKKDLEETIN